jgi:Resolvase, N terminal domain
MRASRTDAEDLTSQLAQLKATDCERVFREKISGATADQPQLEGLTATVGQGDVVIRVATKPHCAPSPRFARSGCREWSHTERPAGVTALELPA